MAAAIKDEIDETVSARLGFPDRDGIMLAVMLLLQYHMRFQLTPLTAPFPTSQMRRCKATPSTCTVWRKSRNSLPKPSIPSSQPLNLEPSRLNLNGLVKSPTCTYSISLFRKNVEKGSEQVTFRTSNRTKFQDRKRYCITLTHAGSLAFFTPPSCQALMDKS